jgi:hypothetical protein
VVLKMAPKKKETTEREVKPKKTYTLDMFKEVLPAADRGRIDFYDTLTDEQKKGFAPLVVMRYMSAVNSYAGRKTVEEHIINVNETVNIGFWDLTKHPELQWKLLALTGSGRNQRHEWITGPKKKTTNRIDNLILGLYPNLNSLELDIAKSKLTRDSLKQLCRDYGMSDDEIKPYVEEFKKYESE